MLVFFEYQRSYLNTLWLNETQGEGDLGHRNTQPRGGGGDSPISWSTGLRFGREKRWTPIRTANLLTSTARLATNARPPVSCQSLVTLTKKKMYGAEITQET